MFETRCVKSEALRSDVLLKVILPDKNEVKNMMILLHGNINPEKAAELWNMLPLELDLEELCNRYQIAVAIPLMENRYYISTKEYDCESLVAQELPDYMKRSYGISESVEVILAGISMGGFGATLISARTGAFRKVISISGAYIANDIEMGNPEVWGSLTPYSQNIRKSFLHYFLPLSDLSQATERNALAALRLFHERSENPKFVVTCGTDEWFYSRNIELIRKMEEAEMDYWFYPVEHGRHDADCFRKGLWKAMEYMSENTIVRKRLVIFGKVQGCGFRRRIRDMADLVGVAGWVWNNQNGSVTVEMQGTEEQIKKTLKLVENNSDLIKIRKIDAADIPVETGDSGFGIR